MLAKFSDLRAFRRDPLGFFLERGTTATEPLAEMRVGLNPVFLVADPALVRPILKAEEAELGKGRLIYKMREVLGLSSLTISGEPHRTRRAAIHQNLAEGTSGDFVPQIGAVVRQTAAALAAENAPSISAHAVTGTLALRIICTVLFGRDALSSGDENALVAAVHLVEDDIAEGIFKAIPDAPWTYWRKKKKVREARQIMAHVVERARTGASRTGLLRTLERIGLEGETLRDEVLLMLLAGHHTSGTAAAWLLYHMAIDPQLCASLAAEAHSLSSRGGELKAGALKGASLSRAFVQEVLRLYPSTYWMSREVKRETEIGGRRLKVGTSLIISPWHLHRDPRHWDEPERFDLDREWTGNVAYMPFGLGPRACVGMLLALLELQIITLELASAFEFSVLSQVPAAPPKPSVTLVPSDIRLALRPRMAAAHGAGTAAKVA